MQELDYLLALDNRGIKQHGDAEAMNNNIRDWLANPVCSVADQPSWGHNLTPFRFAAQGDDTEAMVEMAIISKLPKDVRGLSIAGVRVYWSDFDECQITIRHQYGVVTLTTNRKAL